MATQSKSALLQVITLDNSLINGLQQPQDYTQFMPNFAGTTHTFAHQQQTYATVASTSTKFLLFIFNSVIGVKLRL